MLEIARKEILAENLLLIDEAQEKFKYFDALQTPPQQNVHKSLTEFILIRPQSENDLREMDELIKKGWASPSIWEFAILSPIIEETLQEKLGAEWENSIVVSKNYEDHRMALVGFPIKGKLHLEPFELILEHMRNITLIGSFIFVKKENLQ